MALPFFNSLRQLHPDSKIIAICKSDVAPIFEEYPSISGIIQFEKKDLSGFRATSISGISLRSIDLDIFYLLSDSYRAAYLAYKSECPVRIGYSAQGRNPLLSKVFYKGKNKIHRSEQYVKLLDKRKLIDQQYSNSSILLNQEEIEWANKELKNLGIIEPIAIFPFSVAQSRKIPQHKTISLLNRIDNNVLIFGSLGDSDEADKLISILQKDNIKSIAGHYGLRESIALISRCKAAIASDSGLGHISSNLGIPTVSLFGAGDSELTRPIGERTFIINKNVYCSPCLKNKCHNRREKLLCLNQIETNSVIDAVSNLNSVLRTD